MDQKQYGPKVFGQNSAVFDSFRSFDSLPSIYKCWAYYWQPFRSYWSSTTIRKTPLNNSGIQIWFVLIWEHRNLVWKFLMKRWNCIMQYMRWQLPHVMTVKKNSFRVIIIQWRFNWHYLCYLIILVMKISVNTSSWFNFTNNIILYKQ